MADTYLTLRASNQTVSHIWRTNVQTTLNGSERRKKLYSFPRVKVETEIPVFLNDAQSWLRRELFHHIDDLWGIPVWPDISEITSTASGTNVPCVTTDRHFKVGRECLVLNKNLSDWNDYEVHDIASVSGTFLTLSGTGLSTTWEAGNYAIPLYDCRTNFKVNISRQLQEMDTIKLDCVEAVESTLYDYTAPASGTVTYRDKEVFIYHPTSPKKEVWSKPTSLQQYLGVGLKHTYHTDTVRKYEQELLLSGRDEIHDVLDFFDRHCGRYKSFWFPTWNRDIKLRDAVASDATILPIVDIDYDVEWLPNDVIGRHIMVRLPDGTFVCRKVSNATSNTLILTESLGTAISAAQADGIYISFLELGRFDTDTVEIVYEAGTPDIAYTKLYYHGLIEEAE